MSGQRETSATTGRRWWLGGWAVGRHLGRAVPGASTLPAESSRSWVSSAKLIALCTLLSRVTGLARDILLAQAFGFQWVQDAFQYAFQFPNLFRRLFGEGAMAAAFVPTFTRVLVDEGPTSAWRLLARTLALLTLALTSLILLIALIIAVIWLLVPVAPENLVARRLLLSLTAIMLPFMLTICVLALFSSILNCVGSFVPAALMPVVLNLVMIAAIVWIAPAIAPTDPHGRARVVAWGVVAAGVLQIVLILPVLRANGVRLGWQLDVRDPAVKRMLRLIMPVLLGQGVLAFGVYLDAQVCVLLTRSPNGPASTTLLGCTFVYPLTDGALSAVTYAQRLYQFPLGVLVISLATAALPTFSRLAARGDWSAWSREVRGALRLAVFEGLLTGTMMIVLAEPIFRFLFEHGRVTAQDTARASAIIVFYGFGLWAFCAQHIVLRAFYSLGDVRTPLTVSAALLPLNVALNLTLVWVEGIREAAFAISTSTTSTLSVIFGLLILRRRVAPGLLDRSMLLAGLKMLLAAGTCALLVALIQPSWSTFALRLPGRFLPRACEALGLLLVGSLLFLLVARLVRLPEAGLLIYRRSRRVPADRV